MNGLFSSDWRSISLWLLTLLTIGGFSVFGRRLQGVVTEVVEPRWLASLIFVILVAILLRLRFGNQHRRLSSGVATAAFVLIAAGGAAVYAGLLQPVEAVHFLLFSWFGWVSARTFGPGYGAAVVIAGAIGDEILQHYLPDRVGDLHDIMINTVSGLVGLIARGK